MDIKEIPVSHLEDIQRSLEMGFKVFSPDNIDLVIHKPFKTMDDKVVGMIAFKLDMSIENNAVRQATGIPNVVFDYVTRDGQKLVGRTFITDEDGKVHHPRSNKEAGICLYAMINRVLGKPTYTKLGDGWKKELNPYIGS